MVNQQVLTLGFQREHKSMRIITDMPDCRQADLCSSVNNL